MNLGADKTIAVSWTGFGKPAKAMAKAYNIELRRLEELTAEEITRLRQKTKPMTVFYCDFAIRRIEIDVNYEGTEIPEHHREAINDFIRYATEGEDYLIRPFIYRKSDGRGSSIGNLLSEHQKQLALADKQTPSNWKPEHQITTVLHGKYPPGSIYCSTSQGEFEIVALRLTVLTTYKQKEFALDSVSKYAADSKGFGKIGDFEIVLPRPLNPLHDKMRATCIYPPEDA
jgi:hypothetical protein